MILQPAVLHIPFCSNILTPPLFKKPQFNVHPQFFLTIVSIMYAYYLSFNSLSCPESCPRWHRTHGWGTLWMGCQSLSGHIPGLHWPSVILGIFLVGWWVCGPANSSCSLVGKIYSWGPQSPGLIFNPILVLETYTQLMVNLETPNCLTACLWSAEGNGRYPKDIGVTQREHINLTQTEWR